MLRLPLLPLLFALSLGGCQKPTRPAVPVFDQATLDGLPHRSRPEPTPCLPAAPPPDRRTVRTLVRIGDRVDPAMAERVLTRLVHDLADVGVRLSFVSPAFRTAEEPAVQDAPKAKPEGALRGVQKHFVAYDQAAYVLVLLNQVVARNAPLARSLPDVDGLTLTGVGCRGKPDQAHCQVLARAGGTHRAPVSFVRVFPGGEDIATHEFGHAFLLDHVTGENLVMDPALNQRCAAGFSPEQAKTLRQAIKNARTL